MATGAPLLHLQCAVCRHLSSSHAHLLAHTASTHPSHLENMAVGRLGNMVIYQKTAKLFHCSECFFTCREFSKLYEHLVNCHCMDKARGPGGEEGGDAGRAVTEEARGGSEEEQTQEEEQKRGEKERSCLPSLRQNMSDEGEENAAKGKGCSAPGGEEKVLQLNGSVFLCMCGWKTKLKAMAVGHLMRKHDIPKTYAMQTVRELTAPRDTPIPGHAHNNNDHGAGQKSSSALLREEMEITAKVICYKYNRFICLICGWKSKLKGFAINHVVAVHQVERGYTCDLCSEAFFLPSHLQQHFDAHHRPGLYGCPFCYFRSNCLSGFRRHINRCSAREEEQAGGEGGEEEEEEGGEEEEKEDRSKAEDSSLETRPSATETPL